MKKLLILLLVVVTMSMAGCEKENADNNVKEDVEENVQNEVKDDNVSDETDKEEKVTISIYVPDENYMKMETKEVDISELNAENIIDALKEAEALPKQCEVNSLDIEGSNLELDLNEEFGTYIKGTGTTGEYFTLGCMINTFLDAYDKEAVKITVDGEMLQSGHAEYEGYLTKFNTEM